jgi:hypothetical protein
MRSSLIAGVAATEETLRVFQTLSGRRFGNFLLKAVRAERPYGTTLAVMFFLTRAIRGMEVLLWRVLQVASAEQPVVRAVEPVVNRLAIFLRNSPEEVAQADTMARRVRLESVPFYTLAGHKL